MTWTSRTVVGAVVTLSLALSACGLVESVLGQRGPVATLAKNYETPAAVDHPPSPDVTLELAFDHDTAELLWGKHVPDDLPRRRGEPYRAGIHGDIDRVDFDNQAIALWWGGEATCPQSVTDVQLSGRSTVELHTTEEEPTCADMEVSFRMVLAIDRDRLPNVSQLPGNLVVVTDGNRRHAGQVVPFTDGD